MDQSPGNGNLTDTITRVQQRALALGREGWEMVNFVIVPEYSQGAAAGAASAVQQLTRMHNESWIVTTMFKRPIAP